MAKNFFLNNTQAGTAYNISQGMLFRFLISFGYNPMTNTINREEPNAKDLYAKGQEDILSTVLGSRRSKSKVIRLVLEPS